MPLGSGYWYDRRRRRYISIHDHAIDATNTPGHFRLTRKRTEHLNPIRDREAVITLVAQQGFIRIRHHHGRIGWQFWGDPAGALSTLREYFSRREVGPMAVVTFTDLACHQKVNTVEAQAKDFVDPMGLPGVLALIDFWDNRNVEV